GSRATSENSWAKRRPAISAICPISGSSRSARTSAARCSSGSSPSSPCASRLSRNDGRRGIAVSASTVLIVLLGLTALAYAAGRQRAIAGAGSAPRRTYHSLPGYYGGYVALWCLLPTVCLLAIWLAVEPIVLKAAVIDALPPALQALPEA